MNNNPFDETEDNIRPPDKVKVEKLVEDTRSNYEKEIDDALYISMKEYKKQQECYDIYEEQIMEEYVNLCAKRKEIFEVFLFNLNRLIKYDKEIKEILDIIDPIIESYCNQYIEFVILDELTYDKIFNTLDKVRLNRQTFEILKTIIVKE
jgi:hypothetical protein